MKKLSIVIPMYYEEEVAEECYNRITKVCNSIQNYEYEIIFVNDGSTDDSEKNILNSIKGDYRKVIVDAIGQVPDYEIYYYFILLQI